MIGPETTVCLLAGDSVWSMRMCDLGWSKDCFRVLLVPSFHVSVCPGGTPPWSSWYKNWALTRKQHICSQRAESSDHGGIWYGGPNYILGYRRHQVVSLPYSNLNITACYTKSFIPKIGWQELENQIFYRDKIFKQDISLMSF